MSHPVGIVAGSGIDLEGLLDTIEKEQAFHDTPGLRDGSVKGHGHKFLHGSCGDHTVILQCGRLHLYEGWGLDMVCRPVDVMHSLGVGTILFTNAAGGLLPEMNPGDLVAVSRVRLWPYRGWAHAPEVLDPSFITDGCDFVGDLQWMHGPCYETRAEIGALQRLGAAAVGMSVAPELTRCAELGMRAGVISCVTNSCCRPRQLTHEHVIQTARRASGKLTELLRGVLPMLAAA
ncbi:MAG: hypothetical protein GWP08_00665 [Nitrospiraceae bacterium]|nr:hypothetical protein [Nitrospiraceae bacterium]